MPDMIKFSYIPQNDLRIHGDSVQSSKSRRELSPDFSISSSSKGDHDGDHVLVLEFADNSRGKKAQNTGYAFNNSQHGNTGLYLLTPDSLSAPSSLTPQAVKKLIEKRNESFQRAVDEYVHTNDRVIYRDHPSR